MEGHSRCCFNHAIGLPSRRGKRHPIFNWQYEYLYKPLLEDNNPLDPKNKHVWVKKATGIGASEFYLRLMAWLCLRDDRFQNTVMAIVTGPRQLMTNDLMIRFKRFFQEFFIFDDPVHEATLNKVVVRSYPSKHPEALRSAPNISFFFIDEADFFEKSDQLEVIDSVERYIGKSDPYIVMVSTPNDPEGLFSKLEHEEEEKCVYKRFHIDYRIGLPNDIDKTNVYTHAEMQKAKSSWSFDREYDLKYLGHVGNIFNMNDIAAAFNDKYNPEENLSNYTIVRTMGVDPGFGSSSFALVVNQLVDGKCEIIYADEVDRGRPEECINLVERLVQEWHIHKVLIDGSAAGFIRDLKEDYREFLRWDLMKPEEIDQWITAVEGPLIVPVNFARHGENMLRHLELILQKRLIRIDKRYDKIEIALRTAESKGDKYQLDKDKTSHDDILDALRLSLLNLHL